MKIQEIVIAWNKVLNDKIEMIKWYLFIKIPVIAIYWDFVCSMDFLECYKINPSCVY